MNWHTANKRKRRALARQRTPRKSPLFTPGWRDWLDKILPDIVFQQSYINEHSIFNRIMQPRQYSTYETIRLPTLRTGGSYQTAEGAPLFPVSPNRLERIWRNIWLGQGCKCADCGEPVELEKSAKRSHSFTVVCQKCRERVPMVMIVDDDIDYPDPSPERIAYWDVVPNPLPMKEFIYGDTWVAYRRL